MTDAHRASAANYLVPEPAYSLYLSNMWRKFAEMQIFIVLTICAAVTTAKPGCKAEIEDLCPDFFPPHPPNEGSCQSCASAQQAKFKICNLVRYEEETLTFQSLSPFKLACPVVRVCTGQMRSVEVRVRCSRVNIQHTTWP